MGSTRVTWPERRKMIDRESAGGKEALTAGVLGDGRLMTGMWPCRPPSLAIASSRNGAGRSSEMHMAARDFGPRGCLLGAS